MMKPLEKLEAAQALMQNQPLSKAHNCKTGGVSRYMLCRYLTLNGERC